ncbi:MAG: putative lipid II flippase FtsW [Oscillospiraceae bacterium]|nr:putative lipid II flippase FtsW [Oscillospiraceae bacterium]
MARQKAERLPQQAADARERNLPDLPFLLLTILLTAIGVVMMYSASYPRAFVEENGNGMYFFIRQLIFAVVGVGAMIVVSYLNYQYWRRMSVWVLAGAVLLLVIVLFMKPVNGARRWIPIFGVTVQPSEIAKLGVVLTFSAMLAYKRERLRSFRTGLLPFILIVIVVVGLLALEPHLSAIIIIGLTAFILMYLGEVPGKWLLLLAGAALVFVAVYLALRGYANDRITAWLDPYADPQNKGYQILQSLYAIGSGGLFGLGFGKSRQKYLYLPEEHNDYVFAIVCEELGFVGAALIVLLFALLVIRGYWIAMHAPDRFGKLVAAGQTTLLALQVLLNIGVVTNVLPATGNSLPFFSYGGTALMLQLAEMGIMLNISKNGVNNLL